MKRTLLLSWCVFLLAPLLRADDLPWEANYEKALATAKDLHKPVLIDFSASWCGPCRMMETTTFASAGVQSNLAAYVLVHVDFDQNAALVGKYHVQAIPALFVLNQFGERVSEHVGYLNPGDFRSWLQGGNAAALATVSKNQTAVDRVKTLASALELSDAPARARAAADLMATYCAKDADDDGTGAKLVEQEMRGFVLRHPELALPYLNDGRLAVRILFAGLFAEKFGAEFQFDPWEKSGVRVAAVDALSKKIDLPR